MCELLSALRVVDAGSDRWSGGSKVTSLKLASIAIEIDAVNRSRRSSEVFSSGFGGLPPYVSLLIRCWCYVSAHAS